MGGGLSAPPPTHIAYTLVRVVYTGFGRTEGQKWFGRSSVLFQDFTILLLKIMQFVVPQPRATCVCIMQGIYG